MGDTFAKTWNGYGPARLLTVGAQEVADTRGFKPRTLLTHQRWARPMAMPWKETCHMAGLEDRSSRPNNNPLMVPVWQHELIISVRKTYLNWGPQKIRAHLQTLDPQV